MHIVVTGGCGFIGSNFVNHILSSRSDVFITIVDNMSTGANLDNLDICQDYKDNYQVVNFDISNWKQMDSLFSVLGGSNVFKNMACLYTLGLQEGIHTHMNVTDYGNISHVVNFAAESHVDRSIEDPSDFTKTNATGVSVLCEAIKKHCSSVRFVQVSTDEVYGSLADGEPASTELSNIQPSSMYSATKAAGDMYALSYAHTHGMDVVVTRCSNNYGLNQYEEKLIPMAVTKLYKGEKIPIYGDGSQVRDWIDVVDHCKGIEFAMCKGKSGEVYNFGGDNQITNLEVIQVIADAVGVPFGEAYEFVDDRKGHDTRYSINYDKAVNELGWKPSIKSFSENLTEIVTKTVSINKGRFEKRYGVTEND